MVEVKLLILTATSLTVGLLSWLMSGYKLASKLHLHLYSAVWFSILLAILYAGPEYQVTIKTYVIFCSVWVLIYLGTFLSYPFFYKPRPDPYSSSYSIDYGKMNKILIVLIFLSVVANVIYYKSIFSKLENALEALAALRTDEGYEAKLASSNMFFNTFGRIYNIYLPLAVFLFSKKKLPGFALIIISVIAFLTAAASLTRAPVLNVFVILLASFYVLKVKVSVKALLVGVAVFVGLLYYSTQEIGSLGGEENFSFSETAVYYFVGGVKAFESLLNGHYHPESIYENQYYSLDFVNYFSKRFGFINSYPPLERTYSDLVFTNVYTYLDAFTLDWGLIGLFLCPLVLGFISGIFSCKAKTSQNFAFLVMYCYCCYALALSFMNNEFIRSTFFIVLILALLISVAALVKVIPRYDHR